MGFGWLGSIVSCSLISTNRERMRNCSLGCLVTEENSDGLDVMEVSQMRWQLNMSPSGSAGRLR